MGRGTTRFWKFGGNDYSCLGPNNYPAGGFYISSDGGSTWNKSCGFVAAGWYQAVGDPIAAFDTNGVAYAGNINADSSLSTTVISIFKSTNGGATWSTPVVAVTNLKGGLSDKPWMEIDTNAKSPRKNAIYVSATQFEPTGIQISVSHSTDGGKTWSTIAATPRVSGTTLDQFSDLAIGADGTVYLSYMECQATTGECAGSAAKMFVTKSTDGGVTWSKRVMVHKVMLAPDACSCAYYGSLPNTSERISNIPVIAVDTSTGATAGKLYIIDYTWTGTQMRVQVASSTNGGASWGTPKFLVSAKIKQDQFFPWIYVSSSGLVGATWLDRRKDTNNINYDAFGAASANAGTTYPNKRLSKKSSNPFNDGFGGGFMGDYTGNAWTGKTLYDAWPDTRGGSAAQDEVGGILQ